MKAPSSPPQTPRVFFVLVLLLAALFHPQSAHADSVRSQRHIRHLDFVRIVDIDVSGGGKRLNLVFSAFNRTFRLSLKHNTDLVHHTTFVTVQGSPGSNEKHTVETQFALPSAPAYQGDVVEGLDRRSVGWASIIFESFRFDRSWSDMLFEGTFTIGSTMFHIYETEHYKRIKERYDVDPHTQSLSSRSRPMRTRMIITVDSDSDPDGVAELFGDSLPMDHWKRDVFGGDVQRSCGFNTASSNASIEYESWKMQGTGKAGFLTKRQNSAVNSGCPTSQRILYMAAAADCTYYASQGSSETRVLQSLLSDWNSASLVYQQTFNIALRLINVTIMKTCTPNDPNLRWNSECKTSYTINNRLSDFSKWRGTQSADAGLWHLLTTCSSGASVGVAWLGAVCQTDVTTQSPGTASEAFVSGAGVSSTTTTEWKVVAHEIGHNFNAIHDCTSDQCPCSGNNCGCCPCDGCDCKGAFIMHPTDGSTTNTFSQCTVKSVCSSFPRLGSCLKTTGTIPPLSANICGNGIKEAGEECDCGVGDACKNDPCCNAATCKLKAGAQCADKNDECCSSCKIRPKGFVCRPQDGPCDVAETCSGTNATCPSDVLVTDGTTCNNGLSDSKCASGLCTSRDQQCNNPQLGTTKACTGTGFECKITCATSGTQCLSVGKNYRDGTPCGYGFIGKCISGECKTGTSVVDAVYAFISQSPQIGIPVVVGVALIVLIILLSICRCILCRGGGRKKKTKKAPVENKPLLDASRSVTPASWPVQEQRSTSRLSGQNRSPTPLSNQMRQPDMSSTAREIVRPTQSGPHGRRPSVTEYVQQAGFGVFTSIGDTLNRAGSTGRAAFNSLGETLSRTGSGGRSGRRPEPPPMSPNAPLSPSTPTSRSDVVKQVREKAARKAARQKSSDRNGGGGSSRGNGPSSSTSVKAPPASVQKNEEKIYRR
ncbi:Metallo-peptidase family M12B Reprolysin-like-domain-containing protein [Cladochytrium replicatum]|nr:Metallo-peptidase family M12B Reprolysin-like-domain-containing protein [Cladochytrium replicatum]